jgi:uncharacterized protein involved in outer membrane biogenesis
MKPRWLRILLLTSGSICTLLILIWLLLAWYIHSNKDQLLQRITEGLSEQTGGEITIRNIKPVLWKSFPNISVALTGVSMRDSLWQEHGRSLLEARAIYIRLSPLKLLKREIDIRKITVSNGYLFIFTDANGYSNKYLFGSKKEKKNTTKGSFSLRRFALERFELIMQDRVKQKLFRVRIRKADGHARKRKGLWETRLKLHADVKQFAFNTGKGSFLKDASLRSVLELQFDPASRVLRLEQQQLRIDNWPVELSATFALGGQPPEFHIAIHSAQTPFATAVQWLSPNISAKLDSIFFKKPIDLRADIRGRMKFRDTPLVFVQWHTDQNELRTPFADFTDCSLRGYFLNELTPGRGHNDANTVVAVQEVQAKWGGIPFSADSVRLENLSYPLLQFSFAAAFPLQLMNDIPEPLPFRFDTGQVAAQLYYRGGVRTDDTLPPFVNGYIRITDGAFSYLPRSLAVAQTNAALLLEGDNLLFEDISFRTRNSSIRMKGSAEHFFRFYFADPGKVSIAWHASSPSLDLSDFMGLIGQRKKALTVATQRKDVGGRQAPRAAAGRNRGAAKIIRQLDQVLDASSIRLDVDVDKVRYRQFTAANVRADAFFSQSGIRLSDVYLQHAGGSLSVSGEIDQSAANNPFHAKAEIKNVAVDKLFYAFGNFGQEALRSQHLKGRFSARADIRGKISDQGKLLGSAIYGTVDFSLRDGALVNFEPLLKVSKFAFRRRDLSNIVFKDISNRLDIRGERVIIHPMTIASSALYLDVQGVFGMRGGTDIFMEIPLRNPRKDGFDVNENVIPKEERKKKGITLYLRAHDDGSGNVKLSWDRNRKGLAAKDSLLLQR